VEPRLGSAEDRKLTLRVIAVLLVPLAILAAFALRPATILGVDGPALNSSVSGFMGDCSQLSHNRWLCKGVSGSEAATYTVETKSFGCWDAWRGDRPITHRDPSDSGCISIFDLL
jgi:hypothetical protein